MITQRGSQPGRPRRPDPVIEPHGYDRRYGAVTRLAASIVKEQPRDLPRCAADRADRQRLAPGRSAARTWCAETAVPEVHVLAESVNTGWPAVLTFFRTCLINAATDGTNWLITQVRRQACGFRIAPTTATAYASTAPGHRRKREQAACPPNVGEPPKFSGHFPDASRCRCSSCPRIHPGWLGVIRRVTRRGSPQRRRDRSRRTVS